MLSYLLYLEHSITGIAKRHRPEPCTSNHDCATHHCHSSHEVPYCDHARQHCECARKNFLFILENKNVTDDEF